MSDLHTELELARALFGPQASSGLGVRRVTATATSDSSDGTVAVDVGGEVVEVPVIGAVSTGDEVQLLVDNGVPIAVAATGWGDQLQATATSASAIATAVNQHFWTDTSGVHVTEQGQDATTGPNVLLNSQGLLLRDGTDDLAAFASGGVEFYDNGATTASFNGSGATIGDPDGTHVEMDADTLSFIGTGFRPVEFHVSSSSTLWSGQIVLKVNGSDVFTVDRYGDINGAYHIPSTVGGWKVSRNVGGIIEATITVTARIAATTSYGGRYISALRSQALPSSVFSSIDYAHVAVFSSPGLWDSAMTNVTTSALGYYVVASSSLTQSVTLKFYVRGQ